MARQPKQKTKYEYKITPQSYNYDMKPGETDLQYYRRLAKTADQRLVRLEAASHDPYYKGIEKYAYARAMRDIQAYGGGTRFNTKPPEDREEFRDKIMDMLRFLKSPTSTKYGTKEVYQNRAAKLNEDYPGLNLSWQDMAELFSSGEFEKVWGEYGSDTVWVAIGKIKKNEDKMKKIFKNMKDKSSKTAEEIAKEAGAIKGGPSDQAVEDLLNNDELKNILLEWM